jgi:Ni/Fe-hydrogenase subunit HybB-like protein
MHSVGAVTNLTDQFPWGIWKALVICGIAFAAGGFLTACMVYIFRIRVFYPILRPVVLAAYLGYMLSASGSLLVDLGRYHQIWRPIFFWQHHSVLFEVSWCVMLYTGVLTVEFAPILLDKLGWHKTAHFVHAITVPFVICGVVLSTLHHDLERQTNRQWCASVVYAALSYLQRDEAECRGGVWFPEQNWARPPEPN